MAHVKAATGHKTVQLDNGVTVTEHSSVNVDLTLPLAAAALSAGFIVQIDSAAAPAPNPSVGVSLEELTLRAFGYKGWAFDPAAIAGTTAPTAGTVYGRAVFLRSGEIMTKTDWHVGVAGAGAAPTHIYTGYADATGKMLAQSADLAASAIWTSAHVAQAPLSASWTVPKDGIYYEVLVQVGAWGTTQMALGRGATNVGADGVGVNMFVTGGAGASALPATGSSLALVVTNAINYWAAAS